MARSEETLLGRKRHTPRRVLHIVESWGAGTAKAVQMYVEATPEVEHHLLRRLRGGEWVSTDDLGGFASVTEMPAGLLGPASSIRHALRRLNPELIHAHSSWAGFLTRTTIRNSRRHRILYTPHCYAFERTDIPTYARNIIRLAELILGFNTSIVLACSLREQRLAKEWNPLARAIHVPNRANPALTAPSSMYQTPDEKPIKTVVALGRASPQKDPEFFMKVLRIARSSCPIRAIWIGTADEKTERQLASEGIELTGWRDAAETRLALSEADLLLHTARWEGFPLAVLEANSTALPILIRTLSALPDLPLKTHASDETELARLVVQLLTDRDGDIHQSNVASWTAYLSSNDRCNQRSALLLAYGVAAPKEKRPKDETQRPPQDTRLGNS